MKRTILSIIVVTAIGFSGYHFMQSDKENLKPIKEPDNFNNLNAKNVDQSKEELKQDDFDYRLNMAKNHENGYVDGVCKVPSSPCQMILKEIYTKRLEDHKASIAKARREENGRHLLARKEIEKIEEENRLKREYEKNRDFVKEVSEYTNVVNKTIDFQTASEIEFENSSWVDFIEDYDFKTPVERNQPITNYKVFKTATSEQYFKMFKKNGSFFMSVPLLLGNNAFEYTNLSNKNCELREFESTSSKHSYTASCSDHMISIYAKEDGIEMTFYKKGNGYAHQFLNINNLGEMIVYNEHNKDGTRRKVRSIDFSNFEGQKTKNNFDFKIEILTDLL